MMTPATIIEARESFERADLAVAEEDDGLVALCPVCRFTVRITTDGDGLVYACHKGCTPEQIAEALEQRSSIAEPVTDAVDDLLAEALAPMDDARETLGELLGLADVGQGVERVRIVGQGANASVDLILTSGTTIEFERMKDFAHPGRLSLELAMAAGVERIFKAPQTIKAVTLLRLIAEHDAGLSIDDLSREIGQAFLQSATRHDVDLADQEARWEAFSMLERFDPIAHARRDVISVAQASTVLHDPQGVRFVRCSWFAAHYRREVPTASPQDVAHRMARVGWERRGRRAASRRHRRVGTVSSRGAST
jgi:hypothetical protein